MRGPDVGERGVAEKIEYRILGPLEVSADGRVIEIGGRRLRALLAILLLRANEPVSRDALVHELWGEQPPPGAQHSLEVYISRWRRCGHTVVRQGPRRDLDAAAQRRHPLLAEDRFRFRA